MLQGEGGSAATRVPFDALIVATPDFSRDEILRNAVEAVGGRVLASVGWDEAVARIEATVVAPLLLLDASGADDEQLAATLYRIDGIASGRDLAIVAGLTEAQIDITSAGLVGRQVHLLCEPAPLEWTAAAAVWRASDGAPLHDRVAESEAARLARLNEEVARIADVLARLSRPREVPDSIADMQSALAVGASAPVVIDPADVRQVIRARRLRDRHFGKGLFEDPAWDMMLDLFAAQLERAQVSVSSLCIAAAVPSTTALRWIARMTEAGLFERQPDPFDRRRAFMALSPSGLEGMRGYVATGRAIGLPFV